MPAYDIPGDMPDPTHLASQLAVFEPESPQREAESTRLRSPEQARDLPAAIESGTPQGRGEANGPDGFARNDFDR